ncbi:Eco57I restriction-modification methylase domain-containing protein [Treponema berlinense]|uniref:Eco57I restriction-modification methylase domain-containing protein n=1 Tax=Treponema berlinense TaxID=225004 RepID=UPI00235384B7|nr:N-6 DNA methylase [Treponema berlinense]
MENLRTLFENEYPGKKVLFESLIKPIFVKANDTTLTDEQELSDSDKKQIKSFRIIAQVRGSFPITFADIELQDNVALKRSRVNIQNCVRKVMENDSNALIFFHFTDNAKEWRVSYVNKADSLKNSTSAKRYTYLCGPEHSCRTIAERFSTLEGLSTIRDENMLDAFAVAPLSDDFFNEYRKHYADLVEYISGKRFIKKGGKFVEEKTKKAASEFANSFNGDDKAVRDFVKKMLGRLVFLQFLQKKGWLGVPKNAKWGTGDKNFIYNLFTNADDSVKNDFLEQALEPLFFKSLNCDRGEEAIAPKAVCNIYRSEIRIPYLNGGLFEEDELDKKRVKFKKEHFESIFEFFNQYNFTIDETDTDDVEIGVDPEMLGKIFENLLEDNKDKGAFYTPKEIVQYMCRESLIAYLETETLKPDETASKDKIRNFVLNHEASSFSEKEKADILKALIDVKICDPAVGSGAFPMGMLNELLPCVQILTGEAKTRVELKKHIVKNNIYGVDIEKGAVDIARLRFWLAIIVDEEEPLPLPNLDYKIMQGNSLLESFEGEDLSNMTKQESGNLFDNGETIAKLTQAINGFYIPHDHVAKAKIRAQIKENIIQLLKERQLPPKVIEDLSKLDLHENSQFFLWHTWFYDVFNRPNDCNGRNGFDIVIGNPPYISAPTQLANKFLAEQRERICKSNKYKSLYQKWDLYIPFIELGLNLNCQNGLTAMIVPFPLTNQLYAKVLREIIVKGSNMFELVDLNGTKIFDNATVSNCIPFIKKSVPKEKTWISHINENLEIIKIFEQPFSALVQDEKTQVWNVTQEKREANKYSDFHVLGDFCYVSYGLRLNSDEKTAKGEFTKKDLLSEVEDKIHCRKLIEGKDIEKYNVKRFHYVEWNTDRCPRKLVRPTFSEFYEHPKIFFNFLGNLCAVVDYENKFIHTNLITGAVLWKSLKGVENKSISSSIKKYSKYSRSEMEKLSETVDLKYLLGIMNSKYASVLLTNLRGGDYHIYPEHIRNIPIPPATPAQQQAIIALVDKILAAKKQDSSIDTTALESKIDEFVYDLYGLTEEEKDIIRNN